MRGDKFALLISVLCFACGTTTVPEAAPDAASEPPQPSDPDAASEVRFPDPDWPIGDPADHGFDMAGLDAAAAYSEQVGGLCLVVIRDGELVYERYFNGADAATQHRTWSIAKSFSSALVGAAIHRGEIGGIDDPVAQYVDAWSGTPKESILLRHILTMTSGLEHNLIGDNTWTLLSSNQTEDAIDNAAAAPPGTVWNYSNHAVQVLDAVIESATGLDPENYARQVLWDPIGMGPDTYWERDRSGNTTMYMSVYATCRDLARLGYLYLHHGQWAGSQIIDPDYVAASTSPSQDLNRGYGYLWWTNGGQPAFSATGAEFDGPMFPDAPGELFGAQGLGNNFIDVDPTTNTVFVHTRPAPQDPLTKFVTDLSGTMEKIIEDQQRSVHRELLNLLLGASSN